MLFAVCRSECLPKQVLSYMLCANKPAIRLSNSRCRAALTANGKRQTAKASGGSPC